MYYFQLNVQQICNCENYACMTIRLFRTVIFQSNLSANEIDLLKLYMNVSLYILLYFFF